jgi:hypothetical protein
MRTRLLFLLLAASVVVFGQTTAKQTLSGTVSAPPSSTGNLLTGKTPANYSLPGGWSVLCTQDFEGSLATCKQGSAAIVVTANQTSAQAHSGTHSGYGNQYGTTPYGPGATSWGTTVPDGWSELYQSWYQRLDSFPNGVGFYFSGGDFYVSSYHASSPINYQTILDYCCWSGSGNQVGAFGFSNGPLFFAADNSNLNRFIAQQNAGFDATWHQYEVHYKHSTQSCGTKDSTGGCADGIFELWIDGSKIYSATNVDLNGAAAMNGLEQFISGHTEPILWLRNATSQSGSESTSCNNLWAHNGPFVCGTSVGDGYGCDTSYFGGASYSQINAACPGMAPPSSFNKYLDDIIILYR